MRKKLIVYIGSIGLVATLIAGLMLALSPVGVSITGEGRLSLESSIVLATGSWVSPTGHNDPDSNWSSEASAYDEVEGSYATGSSDNHYLELTLTSAISCDKIRIMWYNRNVAIDVYYSDDWHNIHSGSVAQAQWQEISIGSTQSVSKARVKSIPPGLSSYRWLYEFDFWEVAAACSEDISNTPSSKDFGVVATSTTPVTGLTHFTVTNSSGGAVTITIKATNWTGGVGWTHSDTATPGADTAGLKAGLEGADYTIIVKKTAAYNTLVAGLANSATQKWGLKLYTPTSFSDGVQKTTTVTLTATCD